MLNVQYIEYLDYSKLELVFPGKLVLNSIILFPKLAQVCNTLALSAQSRRTVF